MVTNVVQRAERMASSEPMRKRIFQFLKEEKRTALVEAAERSTVPVTAVSADLVTLFGEAAFASPSMRRFCGLACAAILSEAGFIPDRASIRVSNDPLFSYGTTYRQVGEALPGMSLVARLVNAFDEAELREAESLISARLHELRPRRARNSDLRKA